MNKYTEIDIIKMFATCNSYKRKCKAGFDHLSFRWTKTYLQESHGTL